MGGELDGRSAMRFPNWHWDAGVTQNLPTLPKLTPLTPHGD